METLGNNYTKNYSSKTYNVGIYLRLSREDEESNKTSESIINQKDFLTTYAIENQFNIIDYYIDDGISGTTFDRPSFNKMIADIENGIINTVITKDLSRLGRDYIMVGYYMEKYFPSKNIRYIAVNDGIDTYVETNNDMTPFKAVINDMYAKDISRKIRTAITTKKLKGQFVGSIAPYGYKKDPDNHNQLIIDEEVAHIVRRIFDMFLQGQTILGISNTLSAEKIPTPSENKKLKRNQKIKGIWNDNIIRQILLNRTYTGNLTQNRSQRVSYKINKMRYLPQEQWITVNNTHEAIISEEDFNTAQRLFSKKNYIKRENNKPVSEHLLSGFIFCGDCNFKMTFMKSTPTITYIVCTTWKKHGKLKLCTSHSIREDYLENQVISALKEIAEQYINKNELLKNVNVTNDEKATEQFKKEKNNIEKQLDEIKNIISSLYKDKVKNIISEKDFIEMSKDFSSQRDVLTERLDNIDKEIRAVDEILKNSTSAEQYLKEFLSFENVDRTTLVKLIDRIEIHENKKVILKLNFAEPQEIQ